MLNPQFTWNYMENFGTAWNRFGTIWNILEMDFWYHFWYRPINFWYRFPSFKHHKELEQSDRLDKFRKRDNIRHSMTVNKPVTEIGRHLQIYAIFTHNVLLYYFATKVIKISELYFIYNINLYSLYDCSWYGLRYHPESIGKSSKKSADLLRHEKSGSDCSRFIVYR